MIRARGEGDGAGGGSSYVLRTGDMLLCHNGAEHGPVNVPCEESLVGGTVHCLQGRKTKCQRDIDSPDA